MGEVAIPHPSGGLVTFLEEWVPCPLGAGARAVADEREVLTACQLSTLGSGKVVVGT